MSDTAFDAEAYARTLAAALGLPLEPDFVPEVTAQLATAFRLAPLVLEFPLEDEAEPAPVFRP